MGFTCIVGGKLSGWGQLVHALLVDTVLWSCGLKGTVWTCSVSPDEMV